jgi:hypothetical protein
MLIYSRTFVPLENSFDLKNVISEKKVLSALSKRLVISVSQSLLPVIDELQQL